MVQPIVTLRMLYLSLLISLISTTSYTKRWNTVFVAVYYAYFMYTSAHTARGVRPIPKGVLSIGSFLKG